MNVKLFVDTTIVIIFIFLCSCNPWNFAAISTEKLKIGITHESEIFKIMNLWESRVDKIGKKSIVTDNGITSNIYEYKFTGQPGSFALVRYKMIFFEFVDSLLNGFIYSNSYDSENTKFAFNLSSQITDKKTNKNDIIRLFGNPSGQCKLPSNILHFQLAIKESYEHPAEAIEAWIYHYGFYAGTTLQRMTSQEQFMVIFFDDNEVVVDKYLVNTIRENWDGL